MNNSRSNAPSRVDKNSPEAKTLSANYPPDILVEDSTLKPISVRPPLSNYIAKLWQRRHFIVANARSTSFSNGRDMFLGRLWILIDPLLQVSIYAVIFGLVLQISRGIDNFIGFLVLGVVFFRTATRGISAGSGLIQKSRSMITSFDFPKATLAFSINLKNAIDDIIPVILAVIFALLFQLEKPVSWTILLVLPAFILLYLFCIGATLITARLTAFIPDFKGVVSVLNRGLFFLSGVFFSVDRFDSNPMLQQIMSLNPIYQFLTFIRTCVLDGVAPPTTAWLYLSTVSIVVFVTGFIYFWQAEESYANVR